MFKTEKEGNNIGKGENMEYYHVSKKQNILKLVITLCILGVSFGAIVVGYLKGEEEGTQNSEKKEIIVERMNTKSFRENQSTEEKENITIQQKIEEINHAVVGISKIKNPESTIFLADGAEDLGLGTGIIISEKGYILSNEHVAGEKNSSCYVTLEEGKRHTAQIIWSDKNLDLAILKIEGSEFNKAELGNSEEIKIADEVYAIGNPIGYEFQKTVTKGIISATNRTIKFTENEQEIYMSNLIQTDATINPGNSGGPLINTKGEVIGINTIKVTSAEGIGFAMPINIIKPILQKLEGTGRFEEATFGIFAFDKNVLPYLEEDLEFKDGIYIENIIPNSPAEKAGLLRKDVITYIDDREITKMCELREYIYEKNPGDEIIIKILRRNIPKEISIILEKKK